MPLLGLTLERNSKRKAGLGGGGGLSPYCASFFPSLLSWLRKSHFLLGPLLFATIFVLSLSPAESLPMD